MTVTRPSWVGWTCLSTWWMIRSPKHHRRGCLHDPWDRGQAQALNYRCHAEDAVGAASLGPMPHSQSWYGCVVEETRILKKQSRNSSLGLWWARVGQVDDRVNVAVSWVPMERPAIAQANCPSGRIL